MVTHSLSFVTSARFVTMALWLVFFERLWSAVDDKGETSAASVGESDERTFQVATLSFDKSVSNEMECEW